MQAFLCKCLFIYEKRVPTHYFIHIELPEMQISNFCFVRVSLNYTSAYFSHIIIHEMSAEMAIGKCFKRCHILPVLQQEVIRAVINAEILGNTLALDIGVIAVEINHRMPEILDSHAIAAKCPPAVGIFLLQFFEIPFIQDKALQLVPAPL